MRIALLKGNRFNAWHLKAFTLLEGAPELVAFRAESEIQGYFQERDDATARMFQVEPIWFDTQRGNPLLRVRNRLQARRGRRTPRVLPFADRLKGFDVIQTWELFTDWTAQALEAKRRYGTPVSIIVWDNIPFNHDTDAERAAMKRRALDEADRIVVYTERSRRTMLMEGCDPGKIALIPPGVDTQAFAPHPGDGTAFGMHEDDIVLLFVGWLLPRKGIDWLLMALHELKRDPDTRDLPVRLLVVSGLPGRPWAESLVARLGLRDEVVFTESVPYTRMPAVFRAADVYVQPSVAMPDWQEQFGMALIEAMSSGRPVVAARSGAIPEVVGKAGVLVQSSDFLTLYLALKGLVTDFEKARAIGEAARQRALVYFDVRRQAQALSRIYAELAGQPAGEPVIGGAGVG
jgi:glycosyltransferase involved in cell wall biosynthesis